MVFVELTNDIQVDKLMRKYRTESVMFVTQMSLLHQSLRLLSRSIPVLGNQPR